MQPRSPHWATRVLEVSALSHSALSCPPSPPRAFDLDGESNDGSDGISVSQPSLNVWDTMVSGENNDRKSSISTISAVADMLDEFHTSMEMAGALRRRREAQAVVSVREHALAALLDRLGEEESVDALVNALAAETANGKLAASQAGTRIARSILGDTLG